MAPREASDIVCQTALRPDGMLRYDRTGNAVSFVVNYRHAPRTVVLEAATAAAITRTLDALREEALTEMRTILTDLLETLLPHLPERDGEEEFVDPQFTEAPLTARVRRTGTEMAVTIPPFYAEIADPNTEGAPDRFLAEEYVRAVVRHRTAQLWAEFEHARRNLLEDLFSPPREF